MNLNFILFPAPKKRYSKEQHIVFDQFKHLVKNFKELVWIPKLIYDQEDQKVNPLRKLSTVECNTAQKQQNTLKLSKRSQSQIFTNNSVSLQSKLNKKNNHMTQQEKKSFNSTLNTRIQFMEQPLKKSDETDKSYLEAETFIVYNDENYNLDESQEERFLSNVQSSLHTNRHSKQEDKTSAGTTISTKSNLYQDKGALYMPNLKEKINESFQSCSLLQELIDENQQDLEPLQSPKNIKNYISKTFQGNNIFTSQYKGSSYMFKHSTNSYVGKQNTFLNENNHSTHSFIQNESSISNNLQSGIYLERKPSETQRNPLSEIHKNYSLHQYNSTQKPLPSQQNNVFQQKNKINNSQQKNTFSQYINAVSQQKNAFNQQSKTFFQQNNKSSQQEKDINSQKNAFSQQKIQTSLQNNMNKRLQNQHTYKTLTHNRNQNANKQYNSITKSPKSQRLNQENNKQNTQQNHQYQFNLIKEQISNITYEKQLKLCSTEKQKFIPCLFLKSQQPSNHILIYFHGNGEDISLAYELIDHIRVNLKVNVLAVEYQGYGIYEGDPDENQILKDTLYVYNYLTQKLNYNQKNILILGRSIGSGPATWLAANKKVGCLILISPFTSIRAVVKHVAGSFAQHLIKERFVNIDNIKKVLCPTFIVHGQQDKLIPYTQSQQLHDLCRGPCQLILPKKMTHVDIHFYEDLTNPLQGFLFKNGFNIRYDNSVLNHKNYIQLPNKLYEQPSKSQN